MEHSIRYKQASPITFVGVGVNILLSVGKIIGGIVGHSQALLADGVHSVSDLLTDVLVLFATKYGSRGADYDHPYGHRRIETAATVALALLLITVGALIVVDAGVRIFSGRSPEIPHMIAFWIAIISIISKEILFHATLRVANRLDSNLLRANAWHHRSDAASSLVVLIGIGGALLGYTYLDGIAAIIVGILVVKMGAELAWVSIRELVDTGLDAPMLERIQRVIMGIAGVQAIHQLRTRMMGSAILVDVHIQVDPYLSVSEGHFISQQVHYSLMHAIGSITDVTVHIDPEDDGVAAPLARLPAREIMLALLKKQWIGLPGADDIVRVVMHYLESKIHLEIALPLELLADPAEAQRLTEKYRQAVKNMKEIGSLKLFFVCRGE